MSQRIPWLATLLLPLLLCTGGRAQHPVFQGALRGKVPVVTLPRQDNAALLASELAASRPGRPERFATPLATRIRPQTDGYWLDGNGTSTWYLRIRSAGAHSLNLGFSEYHLPAGAELYLRTPDETVGPFTATDNAAHNELWTPIVLGDELLLELHVPTPAKSKIGLYLTSVNHDFKDLTKSFSGSCNLDVACGGDDGWGIVDRYRDIIRSVGAYSLNGIDACTGFLVNNVNQDGTPYFMTANHCNVSPGNDQSMVVYWNFESPVCRQPGSSASGQTRVGSRAIFNSGTVFVAAASSSDFCLTRLEESPPAAANVFYAGWDLSPAAPRDTVVVIHHPNVDEKRISFSFTATTRTAENIEVADNEGRYLVVDRWNIGTTEGGSSGAPLFDRQRRVRGQLWRGLASCDSPTEFDQFGFFSSSWEGNGTPTTRLRDWLDPCGLGLRQLDGLGAGQLNATLLVDAPCQSVCSGAVVTTGISVGVGFPRGTSVSIREASDGLATSLSASQVSGGGDLELSVNLEEGAPTGRYLVTVRAEGAGTSDEVTLAFDFVDDRPATPDLAGPADNQTGVSSFPEFAWANVAGASSYELQVSTSPDFDAVVLSRVGLPAAAYRSAIALAANTFYYWRVRAQSICGPGEWAMATFTVNDRECRIAESPDLPIGINPIRPNMVTAGVEVVLNDPFTEFAVNIEVTHDYIGDLRGLLSNPSGRQIVLFEAIRSGTCAGVDLSLTFSDDAAQSHTDLQSNCRPGRPTTGAYRPAEPLAQLLGDGRGTGTWTLTLIDEVEFDGGSLDGFSVTACRAAGAGEDYALSARAPVWEVCPNDASTALRLSLGASFGGDPSARVFAGDRELTQFAASVNTADNTLTLNFDGFNGLPAGTYPTTVTLTARNGVARQIEIPLLLQPAPPLTPVGPALPADGTTVTTDGGVEFVWDRTAPADNYTVEVSLDDDFSTLIATRTTRNDRITIDDLPFGNQIFWRVISRNGTGACGGGGQRNQQLHRAEYERSGPGPGPKRFRLSQPRVQLCRHRIRGRVARRRQRRVVRRARPYATAFRRGRLGAAPTGPGRYSGRLVSAPVSIGGAAVHPPPDRGGRAVSSSPILARPPVR